MYHLDTIAEDNANREWFSEKCCKAVLKKWMESNADPTWDMLQNAINWLPKSKKYCYIHIMYHTYVKTITHIYNYLEIINLKIH